MLMTSTVSETIATGFSKPNYEMITLIMQVMVPLKQVTDLVIGAFTRKQTQNLFKA